MAGHGQLGPLASDGQQNKQNRTTHGLAGLGVLLIDEGLQPPFSGADCHLVALLMSLVLARPAPALLPARSVEGRILPSPYLLLRLVLACVRWCILWALN
jgi:hypothetical protein